MDNKHGVVVLGATGYTGIELLRVLQSHPYVHVCGATSRQYAGCVVQDVFPFLEGVRWRFSPDETSPEEWFSKGVRTVFAAFPHGVFAARARSFLDLGMRVIDVSSDFRLKNPSDYVRYYHYEHPDPDLLERAGYGLVEWRPWVAKETMLVANPGCYPTATLLALAPVLGAGLHSGAPVVVNALSGVSGAGRAASVKNLFVEVEGGAGAYKIGQEHAHCAEIQQAMRGMCLSGSSVPSLVFNPHVVPMARGIVATVTVPLVRSCDHNTLLELYRGYYHNSVFVRVLEDTRLPQTRDVRFTNRCDMALRTVENGTMLVVTSVIDNLLKGAAGQAVQHLNIAEQFPMEAGLALCGV